MDSERNSLPATSALTSKSWLSVWPDALAFAGGLGMAWWFDWRVRDSRLEPVAVQLGRWLRDDCLDNIPAGAGGRTRGSD
jgi:hypothetical protein